MHKKASQRFLGMNQTQLSILIFMGAFLLCAIVAFGGYILYELSRPVPVVVLPTSTLPTAAPMLTSAPTLPVQPSPRPSFTPGPTARPTFTAIPTETSFVIPTLKIPTRLPTETPTTPAPIVIPEIPIEALVANLTKCEKVIYNAYWVVVKYPTVWGCDNRDNLIKSTGPGGFMEITLRGGFKTADTFCKKRIEDAQSEERYGKNPTLKMLVIDDQPACLIYPSGDQPARYRQVSLLAVNYPQSTIKGKGLILLIYADKSHIYGFVRSLRFAPPKP